MQRCRTVLFGLLLSVVATTAAHAIAPVTVFGFKAPEEVGGFVLNDSTNFERAKPGEGYGLDYSQSGWKLDVFIYDLKRIAIPDDAKSAIVRAEFERSREDVFLAQPRGLYAQVYLRRNFTIDDAAKRTRFQCAAFYMTRDGAKPQDGFLCVTARNNKFFKFRMTTLSDKDSEAAARKAMASWVPLLWGPGSNVEERAQAKKPRAVPARHVGPARGSPARNSARRFFIAEVA